MYTNLMIHSRIHTYKRTHTYTHILVMTKLKSLGFLVSVNVNVTR